MRCDSGLVSGRERVGQLTGSLTIPCAGSEHPLRQHLSPCRGIQSKLFTQGTWITQDRVQRAFHVRCGAGQGEQVNKALPRWGNASDKRW
jgi:hypothetical protein